MKKFYVYILTNTFNRVLYTGVTNNIFRRILEHKNKRNPESFTARYNVNKLVYIEELEDPIIAIAREKQIKAGSREKKILLIEKLNPDWNDLFLDLVPN